MARTPAARPIRRPPEAEVVAAPEVPDWVLALAFELVPEALAAAAPMREAEAVAREDDMDEAPLPVIAADALVERAEAEEPVEVCKQKCQRQISCSED